MLLYLLSLLFSPRLVLLLALVQLSKWLYNILSNQ